MPFSMLACAKVTLAMRCTAFGDWANRSRRQFIITFFRRMRHLESLSCVVVRLPTCSREAALTLRSNSPFFSICQLKAKPSGTPRIGSGSRTVTTVPSSLRRSVISDEQRWQSQKYSIRLDLDEQSVGSSSRAKKSSVSQITKRSRTRRVRTRDKHRYYS